MPLCHLKMIIYFTLPLGSDSVHHLELGDQPDTFPRSQFFSVFLCFVQIPSGISFSGY